MLLFQVGLMRTSAYRILVQYVPHSFWHSVYEEKCSMLLGLANENIEAVMMCHRYGHVAHLVAPNSHYRNAIILIFSKLEVDKLRSCKLISMEVFFLSLFVLNETNWNDDDK